VPADVRASPTLPFDLSTHPAANSVVARDLLQRLAADTAFYARTANGAKVPRLRMLSDADIDALVNGRTPATAVLAHLQTLETSLERLQTTDVPFVERALARAMLRANRVPLASHTLSEPKARADAATIYALQRIARHRPEIDSAFVTASLLSSRGAADIIDANPYVDDADALLSEIATLALHSTRVAHANRVIGRPAALGDDEWRRAHAVVRSAIRRVRVRVRHDAASSAGRDCQIVVA